MCSPQCVACRQWPWFLGVRIYPLAPASVSPLVERGEHLAAWWQSSPSDQILTSPGCGAPAREFPSEGFRWGGRRWVGRKDQIWGQRYPEGASMSSLSPKSLCRERESCWVNIATTGVCFPDAVPCPGRVTAKGHRASLLTAEPLPQLFTSLRTQNTRSSSFPSSSPLMSLLVFTSLSFLFGANSFHLLPFPALSSSRSLIPRSA